MSKIQNEGPKEIIMIEKKNRNMMPSIPSVSHPNLELIAVRKSVKRHNKNAQKTCQLNDK